jgi:D-serine deaminase-like pyridoxal phosphate-dependent protein
MTDFRNELIDWRYKSFPPLAEPVPLGKVGEQGWKALEGDFLFPVMLIKETALDHNIRLMARYCDAHGVTLAPHGKTPMSPQIVERQLAAGAWGITAANIAEARAFRAFGVPRILLANELIEPAGLAWVAAELAADPEFDFYCLADSRQGVTLMAAALERVRPARSIRVLVELAAPGARAGCRTSEDAAGVAQAIHACPFLELAGVEGYEGALPGATLEARLSAVNDFLQQIRLLTETLYRQDLFAGRGEIVVSAGGSIFFDRVAEVLAAPWELPMPVRVVVRAGTYVTHDVDTYERGSPLAARGAPSERLRPALELWGMILSRPEADLAIAGFGKRDVSYDLALPFPFAIRRSGVTREIADGLTVTTLNDQHAFVRVGPEVDLQVGDLIGCGISHPCTAFDKWRLLPLVDDEYRVVGAIQTYF